MTTEHDRLLEEGPREAPEPLTIDPAAPPGGTTRGGQKQSTRLPWRNPQARQPLPRLARLGSLAVFLGIVAANALGGGRYAWLVPLLVFAAGAAAIARRRRR
jgi:hypothetical protein